MRNVFLMLCVVAVFVVAGCRPAATPVPNTPLPSATPLSPLPTSIAPQAVPEVTREARPSPVNTPSAAAGIRLTATIGPTCPGAQRPGQVCTRPYQGLFIVTDQTNAEVARVTTDQDGKATIDLPPGQYTIMPKVEGKFPLGTPTAVTVPTGQYVEVSIELDSGIR